MLKKCLTKYKKILVLYLLNGWIQITVSMLAILFFQKLIDSITAHTRAESVILLAVYGALQLADYFLSYVDNYPESVLKNGIYYWLKAAAIKKISTIDYLQYKNYGTGRLLQLVENGADAGRNILTHFHLRILREILPNVVISMILIAIYDYKVLLAVVISYGFVFLITKILLKKLYSVKNTTLINDEKLTSKFVRAIMELMVFRLNRRYKNEIEKYELKSSGIVKAKTRILMTHELFFTSFAVIVAAIKITAIFIGIDGVMSGTMSIGEIVALVALIDRVYEPIAVFNVEYVDYKLNNVALERFKEFINQPDDLQLAGDEKFRLEKGCVSFENVSFGYGGTKVLDEFTARFESGKTYAVVGQSGAGKSTLLNLFSGLIKADKGSIKVDFQDLSEINLKSYYEHLVYLGQSPAVFDGTVRENLAFDLDVSDKTLWDALEKVNLKKRIETMGSGLEYKIGEKGNVLSGGEKQRLALARIIVTQPKMVILDEPAGAIDNINESIIMKNVFDALKHSLIVMVTHRVHTSHIFDEVVLLNNGKLEAKGTAERLLESSGLFRKLYRKEKEEI